MIRRFPQILDDASQVFTDHRRTRFPNLRIKSGFPLSLLSLRAEKWFDLVGFSLISGAGPPATATSAGNWGKDCLWSEPVKCQRTGLTIAAYRSFPKAPVGWVGSIALNFHFRAPDTVKTHRRGRGTRRRRVFQLPSSPCIRRRRGGPRVRSTCSFARMGGRGRTKRITGFDSSPMRLAIWRQR